MDRFACWARFIHFYQRFNADEFEDYLFVEKSQDGTFVPTVLRTSLLKENFEYNHIEDFAKQHVDCIVKVQKVIKGYLAKRLMLKIKTKNQEIARL